MMDTVDEDTQAEEDGHEEQGDGDVDGHALLHGPPDQAEVGSRAAISSAVDNWLTNGRCWYIRRTKDKHCVPTGKRKQRRYKSKAPGESSR